MASKSVMEKPAFATIEHIVTDMGNGGAYCSNCSTDLTDYSQDHFDLYIELLRNEGWPRARLYREMPCPTCLLPLKEGGTYISAGGSDF